MTVLAQSSILRITIHSSHDYLESIFLLLAFHQKLHLYGNVSSIDTFFENISLSQMKNFTWLAKYVSRLSAISHLNHPFDVFQFWLTVKPFILQVATRFLFSLHIFQQVSRVLNTSLQIFSFHNLAWAPLLRVAQGLQFRSEILKRVGKGVVFAFNLNSSPIEITFHVLESRSNHIW